MGAQKTGTLSRSRLKPASATSSSVLRHLGIHPLGPGVDSAGKVVHLLKASLLQELDGFCATPAHFAMDDDFPARIQFVHAPGQIVQRNQMSAEVADLIFVGLSHI